MVVTKKITRRPVKIGASSSDEEIKGIEIEKKLINITNEKDDKYSKTAKNNDDGGEDSVSTLYNDNNRVNLTTPLNVNWDGIVTTIQNIGSSIASRANQTLDQLYVLANSTPKLELKNPSSPPISHEEFISDLDSIKEKLKSSNQKISLKEEKVVIEEKEGKESEETKSFIKGIQKKNNPINKINPVIGNVNNRKNSKKIPKAETKEYEHIDSERSKQVNEAQVIEANKNENKVIENDQRNNVESVVQALGGFGKSMVNKARDKYNDLYTIHYSSTDDISLSDLFTMFGGQASLTKLQIQSSEASVSFKRYLKSLKPKEASELNRKAKEIDYLFGSEHLMSNVVLLEGKSQLSPEKFPDLVECINRPKQSNHLYSRHHFAHFTALACHLINIENGDQNSVFEFITQTISELQLLLSQYENSPNLKKEDEKIKMLNDANECIKLLTEAAYQLVPIYKQKLVLKKN